MNTTRLMSLLGVMVTVLLLGASIAQAKPVKLVLASHLGWEVDKTTGGNICTVTSGDECQFAKSNSEPQGYEQAGAVSVVDGEPGDPNNGDVYVADSNAARVQELDSTGKFVLMFGKEVDKTKVAAVKAKGGTPSPEELEEENICTAASGDACQAGVEGAGAGAFGEARSVAVDPSTNRLFVLDLFNWRINEYTLSGKFVLMFGKEVDQTKTAAVKAKGGTPSQKELEEENVCTAESGDVCKAGVRSATGSTERDAFKFTGFHGNLLAVGPPPARLLYVGDEQRIQEIAANGEWQHEISLTGISSEPKSTVLALAVAQSGDVYAVYRVTEEAGVELEFPSEDVIRHFGPSGVEVGHFVVTTRQPGGHADVESLALSTEGILAVSAVEVGVGQFGSVFDAGEGQLITRFAIPSVPPATGVGFNANSELYAAVNHEVLVYIPLPVAELVPVKGSCIDGPEKETDVTLACSLTGTVNPGGVPSTEVWFEWGRTSALGEKTEPQTVPTGEVPVEVSADVATVRPKEEGFYFRLAAYDANVELPEEALESNVASFVTPITTPRIVSAPIAPFARTSSAVLFGELNPENAKTEYFFEYGLPSALASCPSGLKKEACEGVLSTPTLVSSAYGKVGATQEVTGLQPSTKYDYRLYAESLSDDGKEALTSNEGPAPSPISQLETAPAPKVQAVTGDPSSISATSATVSGSVNPDGQPATYVFEVGVVAGAGTHYGVAFSGPVSGVAVAVPESLVLTGLQPGTAYGYRIKIKSGYGVATGEARQFETVGIPEALSGSIVLPMLALPKFSFPEAPHPKPAPKPKCKRGQMRDKHGKCVKARKGRAKKGGAAKSRGKGARHTRK